MLLYSYSRAYGANAQPTIGLWYEPFWIIGPPLIRKDNARDFAHFGLGLR